MHEYSSHEKLTKSRQCEITGGWCSSEEWPKDLPCKCNQCQAYLCETLDHLNRLAEESMRIYDAYSKCKAYLHKALHCIATDKTPGVMFDETEAYSLLYKALMA